MRADIKEITGCCKDLVTMIEAKQPATANNLAVKILELLPPDDFADTAPGVSICTSIPEYLFKTVLPYLHRSAVAWQEFLESPDRPWPEPTTLRTCLAALEEIRAACQGPEGEATKTEETGHV